MTRILLTLMLVISFAAMGCEDKKITASDVRKDLLAEQGNLGETHEQIKNDIAMQWAIEIRAAQQDLRRFFFLDEPSNLIDTPHPE